MKRSLLAITLLLSVSAFAQTLEQAQQAVATAQQALETENGRREQLATEVQSAHQATQEGVGQKHTSVMEQQQAEFRGKTDAYNQCVARCQDLQQRLHQVVAEVGKEHTVVSHGDKFSVQEAPKGNMEPIRRQAATESSYVS